jgi:hypothetical protein
VEINTHSSRNVKVKRRTQRPLQMWEPKISQVCFWIA